MEESNYLQEAFLSFGTEFCRIYIQPNFAVILQKGDIIDLTKDEIKFSDWFYQTSDDRDDCFKEINGNRLLVKERIIENNVLIIKVNIL